ncbi:MAG: bifunctional biotin--[acetyl-CoA-carboxylase] ligase/biotin operon repressor BirA [Gammaproteobacteria bacterium]|nr:bifunctional biotin--[acetyl-CoA-carboxylase] ligase/biotin operon repressor BirA [Gammaproteobacteria bacterium]
MHLQLVRMLADGHFHSGEKLAEAMGLSRAAIWKHLSQIRDRMGIEVFAVRGKGYRLSEPLELFQDSLIRTHLSDTARDRLSKLEIFSSIDSTNSYLMERVEKKSPSGHVCVAEQQTAGRGRRGRYWVSPFGNNIYLSLHWVFTLTLGELSGLSLAAGVAVVKSLESLGLDGIKLKWPNDVLWQNRKLAGLLLEVSGEQDGPSRVVLGLGLNSHMRQDHGMEIDQPWVDLSQIPGGKQISRNRLVAALLNELLDTMARFEAEGLNPLIPGWESYDAYLGQPVVLQVGNRVIEGVHQGIDANGALLLLHEGRLQVYHGGEISLRPGG